MAIDDKIIDKRVVKRSIQKGLISEDGLRNHLESLPDVSDQIHAAEATSGAGAQSREPSPQ